jgi:hypothetical protein
MLMNNFFSSFSKSIPQGCGLTIDAHRTKEDIDVIQFLWAAPLDSCDPVEVQSNVSNAAQESGFIPETNISHSTHLPNETAVLDNCPFQPDACEGKHLVISGSGVSR